MSRRSADEEGRQPVDSCEYRGRLTGESADFPNEMRLIRIAAACGNGRAALGPEMPEGALEAHDASEEPRRQTDARVEASFELPAAQAGRLGQPIDRRVAARGT